MHRRKALAAVPLSVILVLAACGDDDASDDAGPRTVEIDMVDIAFEPDSVDVETGETVRFVFTNKGDVVHDAFIGDEAAQEEHEAEMHEAEEDMNGDMDDEAAHEDDDDGMHGEDGISVEPGETGEITYTFDEPGEILIGCHEPGHYDAGMIVTVNVS
jgi:uncharacterized cupredoxin-like copper-binding protein